MALFFHLLPFHAPELLINSHCLTCSESAHEFINGSLLHLETLFVLVNKFQLTSVSSFHKFQSPVLCIAYCNSATFSDLNVAGSHCYTFPLFIVVTLAIMFIALLLLYFIKRMQWDCSVTVVISCGLDG